MCRQHDDDRPTAWRRHDDDMTTRTRRCNDRATTVISPGSASNPSLWHVISLGSGPNPGLWRSSLRRRTVVSSSCRRHVVVMPSVYRRRAVSTSSSCCRAIAARPSAHCRRAVVSIVIWTRRDFSYPTRACLLNYANRWDSKSTQFSFNAFDHMLSGGPCCCDSHCERHIVAAHCRSQARKILYREDGRKQVHCSTIFISQTLWNKFSLDGASCLKLDEKCGVPLMT